MQVLTRMLKTISRNRFAQVFIVYVRYLIGFAFVVPSLIKIKGERFTAKSGESEPFGSAFHFFETMFQSGFYWQFIGLGQLIAGALLMTQRYAKLGALIYLPIIVNITVIVWSIEFGIGTPVITTLILLANLLLIVWDYQTYKVLINLPLEKTSYRIIENDPFWVKLGIVFLAITCLASFFNRHLAIALLIPFTLVFLISIIWKLGIFRTEAQNNGDKF